MKVSISSIGVIDVNEKIHHIDFKDGLNIITGKSSTGKSAIITIFDYCMGHHTNNIPRGVISDCAFLYFCILKMPTGSLVLARRQDKSTMGFIKSESSLLTVNDIDISYFAEEYFILQDSFRDVLGRYLGLAISETDEGLEIQRSNGRPSVRNMMSFMLQPQNLVANNMGLFYRFDDNERREKVISEFNIFLGLVDQRYYLLKQQLNASKNKLRRLYFEKLTLEERLSLSIDKLDELRDNYEAITGELIFPGIASRELISAPAQYQQELDFSEIEVNEMSEAYKNQYENLCQQKNDLLGKRRKLVLRYQDISSSIKLIDNYNRAMRELRPISFAYKHKNHCPFCNSPSTSTTNEINALQEAINWLNKELRNTPFLSRTYLPEQKKIDADIKEIDCHLEAVNAKINHIKRIGSELTKNISLERQALAVRYQISSVLATAKRINIGSIASMIESSLLEISNLENDLKANYDIEAKIKGIENFIDKSMNEIATTLSFEEEYQPLKFHFDTKKFSLYSSRKGEKVYLSSMGSAANWLYSHLCLFLALMKLFVSHSEKCLIPPILFLDQPSQVYFPTISDEGDQFYADSEDLKEVQNMFISILDFLYDINRQYGWMPQIIITEHADGLDLGKYKFEDYVRKRWRGPNTGLIALT